MAGIRKLRWAYWNPNRPIQRRAPHVHLSLIINAFTFLLRYRSLPVTTYYTINIPPIKIFILYIYGAREIMKYIFHQYYTFDHIVSFYLYLLWRFFFLLTIPLANLFCRNPRGFHSSPHPFL